MGSFNIYYRPKNQLAKKLNVNIKMLLRMSHLLTLNVLQ